MDTHKNELLVLLEESLKNNPTNQAVRRAYLGALIAVGEGSKAKEILSAAASDSNPEIKLKNEMRLLTEVIESFQSQTDTIVAQMGNPLDILAKHFGTDKSSDFHHFTSPYLHHFLPYRQSAKKVLEIGVLGGASLKMWAEFFPHATIYGLDNDPNSFQSNSNRIITTLGDQTDAQFLNSFVAKVGGDFDIVIDDGGHRMREQLTTFSALYPQVRTGGLYVVEDLHSSYWDFCGGGIRKPGTMVEFIKGLIDEQNLYGKCDCGDPIRARKVILEKYPQGLSFLEQNVGPMHIYKGIAFIRRG